MRFEYEINFEQKKKKTLVVFPKQRCHLFLNKLLLILRLFNEN